MAYYGTTAASSLANPPVLVWRSMGGKTNTGSTATPIGQSMWFYGSTDTSSAAFTAGYFTDAQTLGMRQGDIMLYSHLGSTVSSSQVLGMGIVGAVTSTGAALSTGSFISST